MGGVADQKNAAATPFWQFKRLDRGAMDLFVALEHREKGPDRLSERLVALAEPRQPSFSTQVFARLQDMASAVGSAGADGKGAEETAVAEPELDLLLAAALDRSERPQGRMPTIARNEIAERQGPHRRTYPIGPDHELVVGATVVAELDRDASVAAAKRCNRDPQTGARAGKRTHEHVVKCAALQVDRWVAASPHLIEVDFGESAPVASEIPKAPQHCAGALDLGSDPERPQQSHGVGLKGDPQSDRAPRRRALDQLGVEAARSERDGRRQPRDSSAYD